MKMSKKRRAKLYEAIHSSIFNVRVELRLPNRGDVTLADLEHKIWDRVCRALNLPKN